MSPFKALYGQECLTPLKWTDPLIKVQISKDMLDEMQAQTDLICQEIKAAQDRQKSYCGFEEKPSSISRGRYGILKD